ncbi:MAG: plasmid replication initiator TrfA [Polaromonas sp.]|nr:plasmid replication initiator TrfA [Polaromonas sp.]
MTNGSATPRSTAQVATTAPAESLAPRQMPMWGDGARSLPTPFLRSALFRPASTREPRVKMEDDLIEAADGVELRYSGVELRLDDERVLEEILHLARGNMQDDLGVKVVFTGYEMLKRLGRGTGGAEYASLHESITRLQTAKVSFSKVHKNRRRRFQGQLVSAFATDTETGNGPNVHPNSQWTVFIGPYVRTMFGDALLLDQEQRKALRKPYAIWLHGYLSFLQPGQIVQMDSDEVLRTSGTRAARKRDAMNSVRGGLTELQEVGFLARFHVNPNGTITVQRTGELDPALQPNGIGLTEWPELANKVSVAAPRPQPQEVRGLDLVMGDLFDEAAQR